MPMTDAEWLRGIADSVHVTGTWQPEARAMLRRAADRLDAADGLLEACESALEAVDEAYEATGFFRIGKTSNQRMRIEAAIARAKGKEATKP